MQEGLDLSQLIQALVVFVFFVLPVLRSIVKSRQQQEEHRRRANRAPQEETFAERDEDAGRTAWEQLLRGEQVEPRRPDLGRRELELEDLFPTVEQEPEPEPAPEPMPELLRRAPAPPMPSAPPATARRERAADQSMERPDWSLGTSEPGTLEPALGPRGSVAAREPVGGRIERAALEPIGAGPVGLGAARAAPVRAPAAARGTWGPCRLAAGRS